MNLDKFTEYISDYPIYDFRIIDTEDIKVYDRVRMICQNECERYNSTWACPPAVGSLEECDKKIHSYPKALFFSSVAVVSDVLNFDETLKTRHEHEKLTDIVSDYLKKEGHEVFALSTESCDICDRCAYLDNEPCRHPDYMHPCIESFGIVASELVENTQMDYSIGANTILWFSLILFK